MTIAEALIFAGLAVLSASIGGLFGVLWGGVVLGVGLVAIGVRAGVAGGDG